MKKNKYLLLIAIICFFVLPSRISAAPFMRGGTIVERQTGISSYFIPSNELIRGNTYKFYIVSFGGEFVPQLQYPILEFKIDNNVFEIKNFESKYGFRIDNNKIKLEGDKLEKEGFIVNVENDSTLLWAFELEVKSDAKLGEVEILGQKYKIVCDEGEECSQYNNDQNSNINEENNAKDLNERVILNDTKFYVLAGLFGTVVIELFVLILKKSKKA